MNKKIMLALGAMAIAAFLGLIFSQNLSVSAGPDLTRDDIKEKVQSQYPGEIKELELDDAGKDPVYEVEIVIEGKEYELLIDGNSGEVLKLDEKTKARAEDKQEADSADKEDKALEINEKTEEDADDSNKSDDDKQAEEKRTTENKSTENNTVSAPKEETKKTNQAASKEPAKAKEQEQKEPQKQTQKESNAQAKKQETKPAPKKESNKKSTISREKAIQIALGQFSGNVEEAELDKDDGRLIYEVEIESSRGEAEIIIDAYTGKVLMADIDLEDDDDDDD